MKEFLIDGITVKTNQEECTRECAEKYLVYAEEHKEDAEAKIKSIRATVDGDGVDLVTEYVQDKPKFERIRRITG